jgi:hypothetical protein
VETSIIGSRNISPSLALRVGVGRLRCKPLAVVGGLRGTVRGLGKAVILRAAENAVGTVISREVLRCAQNDRHPVNGYGSCMLSPAGSLLVNNNVVFPIFTA